MMMSRNAMRGDLSGAPRAVNRDRKPTARAVLRRPFAQSGRYQRAQ
jgi:hypothetical protein